MTSLAIPHDWPVLKIYPVILIERFKLKIKGELITFSESVKVPLKTNFKILSGIEVVVNNLAILNEPCSVCLIFQAGKYLIRSVKLTRKLYLISSLIFFLKLSSKVASDPVFAAVERKGISACKVLYITCALFSFKFKRHIFDIGIDPELRSLVLFLAGHLYVELNMSFCICYCFAFGDDKVLSSINKYLR